MTSSLWEIYSGVTISSRSSNRIKEMSMRKATGYLCNQADQVERGRVGAVLRQRRGYQT